jgi:hypothetical protein
MTLIAFDPSLSNKQLCYSIVQNDYFGLEYNQDISPTGSVILKKKIDFRSLFSNTLTSTLNFTALLYYCNEDIILSKQVVTIFVKSVNKYAPTLIKRVNKIEFIFINLNITILFKLTAIINLSYFFKPIKQLFNRCFKYFGFGYFSI